MSRVLSIREKDPRCFHSLFSQWEFAEFHLQNSNGEELHGVMKPGYSPIVQITRHRANCGTELEECIKGENFMEYQSRIRICNPTVG